MSRRPNYREPGRNAIKPQMEKLEIRWLLSQTQGLTGSSRPRDRMLADVGGIGGVLGRALVRWETHHPDAAPTSAVAVESFEAKELMPYSQGSWGGLRLLVRMERQGES